MGWEMGRPNSEPDRHGQKGQTTSPKLKVLTQHPLKKSNATVYYDL
jgi:hypothetical protein